MPLYEYYCEPCNVIYEAIRQMREASDPVPCPECSRDGDRIMSTFAAFTMRDGYPRRIPDKGTFWHMGKEVKQRAKRMKNWTHPELAEPKSAPRPTKEDVRTAQDKAVAEASNARYRDRWGIDAQGFRTVKAKKKKPKRKTVK